MQHFINRLLPFIFVGIAIVAFAFGVMLMAYLFLIGALVGFVLFTIAWIRQKFFQTKTLTKTKSKTGRTIDANDWKKM